MLDQFKRFVDWLLSHKEDKIIIIILIGFCGYLGREKINETKDRIALRNRWDAKGDRKDSLIQVQFANIIAAYEKVTERLAKCESEKSDLNKELLTEIRQARIDAEQARLKTEAINNKLTKTIRNAK